MRNKMDSSCLKIKLGGFSVLVLSEKLDNSIISSASHLTFRPKTSIILWSNLHHTPISIVFLYIIAIKKKRENI